MVAHGARPRCVAFTAEQAGSTAALIEIWFLARRNYAYSSGGSI
jgi:hypothetical protein